MRPKKISWRHALLKSPQNITEPRPVYRRRRATAAKVGGGVRRALFQRGQRGHGGRVGGQGGAGGGGGGGLHNSWHNLVQVGDEAQGWMERQ